MNSKSISLAIRVLISLALGYLLIQYGFKELEGEGTDLASRFFGLALTVAYGGLIFAFFGVPLIRRLGEKASGIFMPSDENFRIMPEYSLAEARLKTGDYEAAITEYRAVIDKFPEDVYAHVQIAKIAADFLDDQRLAEAELLTATAKANTESTMVLAYNRLADHYHLRLKNTHRAIDVIKQLREKVGPVAAERTKERLLALHAAAQKTAPDDLPSKITFRAADEDTLKKRRGF